MLDKILEQAKGQLLPSLTNDPEVDNAQAEQIAEVGGESVISSLMDKVKGGDLSGLQEMLSGEDSNGASPAVNQFIPKVAENLASKLGIAPETAQNLAAKIVPVIMNMFNGKVRDAKNQGIDIGGLLGGLAGGAQGGQGGGLMDKIGGLFGGGNKDGDAAGKQQPDVSEILGKFL